MQQSSNLILGGLKLPFDERQGESPIERQDCNFRFLYRRIPFSVHFRTVDMVSMLEIVGDIGLMPYSAESALARIELQTVFDAANAHLGEVFAIHEGRIRMTGTVTVVPPVSAVALITAITHFLIKRRPYLETLEVFLTPSGEAEKPGEAVLRPSWRGMTASRRVKR